MANARTPQEAYEQKKIHRAVTGLKIAILMPITAIVMNLFNTAVTEAIAPTLPDKMLISAIISITLVGIGDFVGGIIALFYYLAKGKTLAEFKRTGGLKISWMMLLAALVAGPLATGCWMAATPFCGLTMVAIITSLNPILSAFISRFTVHEKLNKRIYLGIVVVVVGVVIAGWEGFSGGGNYIIGIILALMAPIGFTLESQFSTYAGDLIDPNVGCVMYRGIGGGILGMLTMVILAGATGNMEAYITIFKMVLSNPTLLLFTIALGVLQVINENAAYSAFNMAGPSRTFAIDSTRPVWSIPFGYLFAALGITSYAVSGMAIVGAIVVVVGLVLTIANPKDLANLRDVE